MKIYHQVALKNQFGEERKWGKEGRWKKKYIKNKGDCENGEGWFKIIVEIFQESKWIGFEKDTGERQNKDVEIENKEKKN